MPTLKRIRSFVITGAFGAAALSCSSATSSTTPITASFSEIYPQIFPVTTKAQCSFCHGLPPNEKSNGNLSTGADSASAYAALVGTSSTSAKCSGKPYVVPGKPDESLLILKLTTPPCGDRMPLGGDPLSSEQIASIRAWISAGAKDD
jgi:mono/diheme cytochrome c family protein